MEIFEQTNKRIDTLNKIKRQKEAISNGLKIEWETDPKKMQFNKLRSYNVLEDKFNFEIVGVEECNITSHNYTDVFTFN